MSTKGRIGICPVCRSYFPKDSPEVLSAFINGHLLLFDNFQCADVFERMLIVMDGKNTNIQMYEQCRAGDEDEK